MRYRRRDAKKIRNCIKDCYPISICQFFVEEAKNRKRINVHDLVVFLQCGHFETSNLIDLFDLLYECLTVGFIPKELLRQFHVEINPIKLICVAHV